ncbi:monovalent cation/H(+) antiporter subunit G [Halobacteriales archaeon Cl-PHB]
MSAVDYATVGLVVLGAFFGFVAMLGLLRLPDLYARSHASSKAETLSSLLALAAVGLTIEPGLPTAKTVLLLVFTFLTAPTAAHAITRAAYDEGIEPWTAEDDEAATEVSD